MTQFEKPSFSVHVGGKRFAEGWEKTFGPKIGAEAKEHCETPAPLNHIGSSMRSLYEELGEDNNLDENIARAEALRERAEVRELLEKQRTTRLEFLKEVPAPSPEEAREIRRELGIPIYTKWTTLYENLAACQTEDLSSLLDFQNANQEWVDYNFPGQTGDDNIMGMTEELGELAHAQLKAKQGIRGTAAEHAAAKKDAVGDLLIFVLGYCNAEGLNAEECLAKAWQEIRTRDWIWFPKNGRTE